MVWLEQLAVHLWQNTWAVIPLAIVAAFACRTFRCGPVTRHAVWVVVLAWFLIPPLLPAPPSEQWFREAEARVEGPAMAALSAALHDAWSGAQSGERSVVDAGEPIAGDSAESGSGGGVVPVETVTPSVNRVDESSSRNTIDAVSPAHSEVNASPVLRVPPPILSIPAAGDSRNLRPSAPDRRLARRESPSAREIRAPEPFGVVQKETGVLPSTRSVAKGRDRTDGTGENRAHSPTDDSPASRSDLPGTTASRAGDSQGTTALHPRLAAPLDANPSVCPPTTDQIEGRRTSLHNATSPDAVFTPAGAADGAATRGDSTTPASSAAHTAPASPATRTPGNDGVAGDAASPRQPWWEAWFAALLILRNVLGGLPAVPAGIWAAGAAVVLLWNLVGVALFFYRLRGCAPAPAWVVREAQRVANRLGLRRLPAIRLVDARISPMVWCGWRPMLILPTALWRELDHVGRCAILCHELAHLRRRDHWVLRLDLLVSVLFWWHPVAWWTRRRIHEEADNCCDAWVTWLMPRNRRAYAEALLKTRVYIEKTTQATPAMGVAVTTPGARRLARRLTMVMTQNVRPRQSMSGFLVAAIVLGSGWMLMPAVTVAQSAAPVAPAAPAEAVAAVAPVAGAPAADETADAAASVPLFAPVPPTDEATPAPTARGAAAGGRVGRTTPAGAWVGAPTSPATIVAIADDESTVTKKYRIPEGKREALTALLSRDDVPLQIRPTDDGLEVIGTAREQEQFAAFLRAIDKREEQQESRSYRLPAAKLEALYALMVRDDVPIVVSRSDDTLNANGTTSQLAALDAFIGLIHPQASRAGGGRGSSTTPRGALRGTGRGSAAGAATVPPSPPPVYGPGGGAYSVPAAPFVPTQPKAPKMKDGAAKTAPPAAAQRARELMARGEATKARNEALKAQRQALQSNLDNLRARQKAQQAQRQAQMKQLRERAREVQKQSELLEPKVRAIQQEMDAKREKADDAGDDRGRRREIEKEIRELQQRARELEREVKRLNRESAHLEAQAEDLDAVDDPIEIAIERLEADIEAIESAASDDVDFFDATDDDGALQLFPQDKYFAAPGSDLFNTDTSIFYSMMAGLPRQFDDQAQRAFESALRDAQRTLSPKVRDTVREACEQAREKVRRSLDAAMRDVKSELLGKLGGNDMDDLSQRISEAVNDAISEAMEGAFDGLEDALEDVDVDFEFQLGDLDAALKAAIECSGGGASTCSEACKASCSKTCQESSGKKDGPTAPAHSGKPDKHETMARPAERP